MPTYSRKCGLPLERGWRGRYSWRKLSLPLLTIAHSSRFQLRFLFPSPCEDLVWLWLSRVSCMLSQPLWIRICSCPVVSRRCRSLVVIHQPWHIHAFCPLFCDDQSRGRGGGCGMYAPYRAELPAVFSPLHLRQLWVSVLITIMGKQRLLRGSLRYALIYAYSGKALGISLMSYPFNKVNTRRFSPGAFS